MSKGKFNGDASLAAIASNKSGKGCKRRSDEALQLQVFMNALRECLDLEPLYGEGKKYYGGVRNYSSPRLGSGPKSHQLGYKAT